MVGNLKQKLFCWGFLAEVSYFEKKQILSGSEVAEAQQDADRISDFVNLPVQFLQDAQSDVHE